jgi:RNase P/RNase MRP subunit p29
MNAFPRIKTGDKMEIIDKNSPYFGKTGTVTNIIQRNLVLNGKSGTMTILKLELEDLKTIIDITSHPIRLDSQIKKL